jgi:PKD repeat protein
MRATRSVCVGLVIALCACGEGMVWAADSPAAPAPRPTLTQEQEAILKKILIDTEAKPDEGPAPLTVHFSAKPYPVDEDVKATYVWDFGDGSPPAREANPTHTYKKPGEYKAVVKATAPGDMAGSDDIDITVDEPEPPAEQKKK